MNKIGDNFVLTVEEVKKLAKHFYSKLGVSKIEEELRVIHAIVNVNKYLEFPFTTELRWSNICGTIYINEGYAHESKQLQLTQDRLDMYPIKPEYYNELRDLLRGLA